MRAVNIQDAKTHLSRLVEEAQAGEDIVISKAGRPCVRLVPVTPDDTPRELGRLRGKVVVAADFDAPSQEIDALFGGGDLDPAKREPRARQRSRPRGTKGAR